MLAIIISIGIIIAAMFIYDKWVKKPCGCQEAH